MGKRLFALIVALVVLAPAATGQDRKLNPLMVPPMNLEGTWDAGNLTNHLSWEMPISSSATLVGFVVYRAPSGATFAPLWSHEIIGAGTLQYDDVVPSAAPYIYAVSALYAGTGAELEESAPSLPATTYPPCGVVAIDDGGSPPTLHPECVLP